jgi:hypothetical protein
MSFIVKAGGGAVNWSAVTIDADKDMLGRGLSNVKEVAAAMIGGDLVAKGLGGILVRIPAGVANTVLTSAGIGLVPTWAPGGLYLNRYYPVSINLTDAETKRAGPDKSAAKTPAISSAYVAELGDDVANMLSLLSPAITMPDTEVDHGAADQTDSETPVIGSKYDLQKVLDGAVADDGGATTDETAVAQSAAANDMTLLPAVPVTNDAYYFGSSYPFDEMILNIGTAGNGVWTLAWEYYDNDTTWHALAGLVDGTSAFKAAVGLRSVTFTRPGTWQTVAIGGIGPFYWIRAVVTYTSIVTQPKGTQSWYKITI